MAKVKTLEEMAFEMRSRLLASRSRNNLTSHIKEIIKTPSTLIADEKSKAIERLCKEVKEKRKLARSALSFELRKARKRRSELKWELVNLELVLERKAKDHERTSRHELARRLRNSRARLQNIKTAECNALESFNNRVNDYIGLCNYPCPPVGDALPTTQGTGIPIAPGIYFLWNSGKCEYVGKSINLNQRLRLRSHHVLQQHHTLSWIVFPQCELTWVECYYIGVVRPQLNFGQNANHKQLNDQPIRSCDMTPGGAVT